MSSSSAARVTWTPATGFLDDVERREADRIARAAAALEER
jgi:hypothetical protein